MTKKKEETAIEETEKVEKVAETESKYLVKFDKPYKFEGNEYTEIDLCNIENLTAIKMMEADKIFASKGYVDPLKEVNLAYSLIVAYLMTDKPLEFYTNLRANEAMKIKNVVSGFLFQ